MRGLLQRLAPDVAAELRRRMHARWPFDYDAFNAGVMALSTFLSVWAVQLFFGPVTALAGAGHRVRPVTAPSPRFSHRTPRFMQSEVLSPIERRTGARGALA